LSLLKLKGSDDFADGFAVIVTEGGDRFEWLCFLGEEKGLVLMGESLLFGQWQKVLGFC